MKTPQIHETVFVAPNATVVGDVRIGAHSSIFFGAVLRTESDEILIGEASNILFSLNFCYDFTKIL